MSLPLVKQGKVRGLGVIIITVAKLVLQISAEVAELLSVGPTEHKCPQVYVMDLGQSQFAFSIGGVSRVRDFTISCQSLDLRGGKRGNNSNRALTTIRFNSFNIGKELLVVSIVVNPITLIMSIKVLV